MSSERSTGRNAAPSDPVSPLRIITDAGHCVQLDLSGQVLSLSILEDPDFSLGFADNDRAVEPELTASPAVLNPQKFFWRSHRFVSASLLAQKAKQFDDGLYAAIELAVQKGAGSFSGKQAMLRVVAEALAGAAVRGFGNVRATILAGAQLGGLPPPGSAEVRAEVETAVAEFMGNPLRSKPLGFYGWDRELSAIFQQDRMLQGELIGAEGIAALARVLHHDPKQRRAYEQTLELAERLTNPLSKDDLRPLLRQLDEDTFRAPGDKVHFFPPSCSREADLVTRLYGDTPIPEGFSLVDEMIGRIRAGRLALEPTEHSGWYDYQTWALEPLVIPEKMPEAKHLQLDESYRKQLLELFRGLIALTRETHVKQLEHPVMETAAMPKREIVIRIDPGLSVEPVASFYLRRAQSYRFVRNVLESSFGSRAIAGMRRLTADGPVKVDLATELDQVLALFAGAYVQVGRQIGMSERLPAELGEPAEVERAFATWSQSLSSDPDLGKDSRMMVPIFFDLERKKVKVWAVLGWASKMVVIDFVKQPAAIVMDDRGQPVTKDPPRLYFCPSVENLDYPVFAEIYVDELMNRDEFRRLCDQQKTASAILRALQPR